mmetsp:Transcript_8909/g.32873  ORF Transcript_8909/g.32873 Transcript_8909/m.32873 type:complete len:125 (-) Transcript_8909:1181-1555(-)
MPPIHGLPEATKHLTTLRKSLTASSSKKSQFTLPPVPQIIPSHLSNKPPQYFQLLQYYRILYRLAEQYPSRRLERHNKHFLKKLYSRKGRGPISRRQWNDEVRKARDLETKWRRELLDMRQQHL